MDENPNVNDVEIKQEFDEENIKPEEDYFEEATEELKGNEEKAFPDMKDEGTEVDNNRTNTKTEDAPFSIEEVLKKKVKLKDGVLAFEFSRGPKYSEDKWPINCHVCRLGNLLTKDQVQAHMNSRRHLGKVNTIFLDSEKYNVPFYQCPNKERKLDQPIKIYPGEIIGELKPDLMDRLIKSEEFEVKKPSEDIINELSDEPMHDYDSRLPLLGLCYMYKMKGVAGVSYYCTLCCSKVREEVFQHVTGANHQFKYIERHFPKLYGQAVDALKREQSVDMKLCIRNIFRKLYRKIENAKGFKKVTIVDDEDFYANRRKYMVKTRFDEHYDENTILITDHEFQILIRKCINRMEFIKPDLESLDDLKDVERDDKGRLLLRSFYRKSKESHKRDYARWTRYHLQIQKEVDVLNRQYQAYNSFNKKHPLYQKIMNDYFKEAEKDSRKLNKLKKNWNAHWSRRLRDLYDEDLAKCKLNLKRKLRLRTDVRTPSPVSRKRSSHSSQRSPSPKRERRYEDRPGPRDNNDIQSTPPNERLGVISVLRLLTALEDQLGSLGPKAVQFMSRAVLAEKSNQNPNDLMMENEVYIFFVTAKEKLKGQIFANIVEQHMMAAINRAIADTSTLLDMFEDYMRRTGKRPVASSSSLINQYDNTPPQNNSYHLPMQANQYGSVGRNQYTTDVNGSGNNFNVSEYSRPVSPYFRLKSSSYQTGSGAGHNRYMREGGGGNMNQYRDISPVQSGNQYSNQGNDNDRFNASSSNMQSRGNQGGIWQNVSGTYEDYSQLPGFQSRTINNTMNRMY